MKIKVMTDSTADLPVAIIRDYEIEVLPLSVHFGTESFLDKVDLSGIEFFEKLKTTETLPTTSQVSVGRFLEAFEAHQDADLIVFIGISDALSGTLSSARLAAREYPEGKILIFDSLHVTFGLGLIVLEFARQKENMKSYYEAKRYLTILRNQIQSWFLVDTLEYLVKGGRLSALKGVVGSLLKVKPILKMEEGKLGIFKSERGKRKAMNTLLKQVQQDFPEGRIDQIAIYHAVDPQSMEEMKRLIDENFVVKEWIFSEVGSVVGTHAGPGCLAVSYFKREDQAMD